jgi:hypothetical protein
MQESRKQKFLRRRYVEQKNAASCKEAILQKNFFTLKDCRDRGFLVWGKKTFLQNGDASKHNTG